MTNEDDSPRTWRDLFANAITSVSPGVLSGLLCGAVIGGLGGRMAMFVLRLTSDDSLRGMKTDDDFTIGSFTGDTFFLVLAAMLLGVVGGLLYLGVRNWLPERWRPALFGLFGATAGGTLIIRPDGIDFTLLEPLWLAVAMFVVLPAAYGVAVSVLTERLVRSSSFEHGRWRWVAVPLLLSVIVTGLFGVTFLILVGVALVVNRSGYVTRLWRSTPVTWVGRGVFGTAMAVTGVLLVGDVVAVL